MHITKRKSDPTLDVRVWDDEITIMGQRTHDGRDKSVTISGVDDDDKDSIIRALGGVCLDRLSPEDKVALIRQLGGTPPGEDPGTGMSPAPPLPVFDVESLTASARSLLPGFPRGIALTDAHQKVFDELISAGYIECSADDDRYPVYSYTNAYRESA